MCKIGPEPVLYLQKLSTVLRNLVFYLRLFSRLLITFFRAAMFSVVIASGPSVVISRSSIFFSASCRFNPKPSSFLSMETIAAWIRSRLPEISTACLVKKSDNTGWPRTTALDVAKPKAGKQVSPFNRLKAVYEYAARSLADLHFLKGMLKSLSVLVRKS